MTISLCSSHELKVYLEVVIDLLTSPENRHLVKESRHLAVEGQAVEHFHDAMVGMILVGPETNQTFVAELCVLQKNLFITGNA